MKLLVLFFLLCSHLPLLWACLRALRNKRLPSSIDLVAVSFLIYFDLEIALEAFGGKFENDFFRPFFSASDWALTWSFLALLIGPWLLKFGYWIIPQPEGLPFRHRIRNLKLFYAASTLSCSVITLWSLSKFFSLASLTETHSAFGENFGSLSTLLYLPLGIFTFYLAQPESKTFRGKIYLSILLLLSVLSMLSTGERTLILIPFLLLAIFYRRPSLSRIAIIVGLLLFVAVIMLPLYRWNYQESSNAESAAGLFTTDLARAPELIYNIDHSRLIGTKVLPYPGAGYAFAALLYVPRNIAPWKGFSTARFLTAYITHARPGDIDWGFGGGAVDELILNFGILAVFPGLMLYGMAFALFDRLAFRFPVLGISTRLTAVWLCGYDIVAIIGLFGVIAVIGIACQIAFTRKQRTVSVTVQPYTSPLSPLG